jgi:tRNA(fMet)-specific endonuclease VapC
MLFYLLDTNICIDEIKRRSQEQLDTFNRHAGQMATSAITFSELLHGVEKSAAPARNLVAVEDFCSRLDLLAYVVKASLHDLHITAHARSEGLTLVSNNLREFERVPGLLLENWA